MKSKLLITMVAIATLLFISCKKEEITIKKSVDIKTQEILETNALALSSTTNTPYYCAEILTEKTIWLSPGNFLLTIDNLGNRTALVFIYPRTVTDVDRGNIIDHFSIPSGLNYCLLKSYNLPTRYSGLLIEIRKDRPSGGYVEGDIGIN